MRIRARSHRVVVAVVYVTAMFMSVLDTTIVTIALPAVARDFHVTIAAVASVTVAYLVALTVFIPVSGWLGDSIGAERALLGSIGLFTIGSALCAASPTFTALIVFSVLQGIGGAIMLPVGLAMLFRVYPPSERVRLSATLALVTAIGPALGPVLGGALVTLASWRLVFLVNVPIGAAIVVWGAIRLRAAPVPHPGRLDLPGFLLSALGLGLLIGGVSETTARGWNDPVALAAAGAGLATLVGLVAVERRVPRPLIDLRLLRHRLFAAATGLYALGSVAYIGALYLVTAFLQEALGLSALTTGFTSVASAVGVVLGGQLVTRVLYPRFGPRRLVAAGLLVISASLAVMALAGAETGLWLIRADLLALGLGVSAVFIPSQAISMATISKADTAKASPIFTASKQLGSAVGVALLATVVAAAHESPATGGSSSLRSYHVAFIVAAAVALASVAVALTIRDREAAGTMRRPGRAEAASADGRDVFERSARTRSRSSTRRGVGRG